MEYALGLVLRHPRVEKAQALRNVLRFRVYLSSQLLKHDGFEYLRRFFRVMDADD